MSFLKITDPEKRDFLVKEFLMSKHNIRQNSLYEKLGDIGLQRELTKLYKPITDSQALQVLPASLAAIMPKPSTTPFAIDFPHYPSIQAEGPKESLIELGPIATEYLRSMASKTLTDKTFGLHDKKGAFYIGEWEVTIFGDDIIVGETKFEGTPGLWELITSKSPDSGIYTTDDLDSYEAILLNTNAIVNPITGKVRSSSSDKYRNIIKPIYIQHLRPKKASTTGEGISLMPSDPNALIEMLGLWAASYRAGNTGVRNDIVDISDELLRQNIIDKDSYKKIMLQL
jgi:hypothetical protein